MLGLSTERASEAFSVSGEAQHDVQEEILKGGEDAMKDNHTLDVPSLGSLYCTGGVRLATVRVKVAVYRKRQERAKCETMEIRRGGRS